MGRFGEKLRFLRHQRGMTLRELADALGFRSHGFVGDLESGRKHPSLDLAVRIADFFGVPLDRLARDDLDLDTEEIKTSTEADTKPCSGLERNCGDCGNVTA